MVFACHRLGQSVFVLANVVIQQYFNAACSPLKGSFKDKFVTFNHCHSKFENSIATK